MHITTCKELIVSQFGKDWEKQVVFGASDFIENNLEFIGNLDTLLKDCFKHLNLSVLAGEYVNHLNFPEELKSLGACLDFVTSIHLPEGVDLESEEDLAGLLYSKIVTPLQLAIASYRLHHKKVNDKYSHPDKLSILMAYQKHDEELDTIDHTAIRFLSIFESNLKISFTDHNFSYKEGVLEALLMRYHNIADQDKGGGDEVITLLSNKCSYLLKKLLLHSGKDPSDYYYEIEEENKSLDHNEFNVGAFQGFSDITSLHYDLSPPIGIKKTKRERIEKIKAQINANKQLTFEESLLYINHSIDCLSFQEATQLVEEFKGIPITELPFNKIAFEVTLINLENQLLNVELSDINSNFEFSKIKTFLDKVNKLQSNAHIKNYYPYLKLGSSLINYINSELDKEVIEFNKLGQVLEFLCKKIENKLVSTFAWCVESNFIPCQLPFEECLIEFDLDGKKEKLFLASSFVLPINFPKIKNEISEITREINDLKSRFSIIKSISKEKDLLKKIKEDIEKTDKRHIEILSVFSAIVLFVSGNIQIFTRVNSITDALRFMLLFAYVLILFISVIWMITRVGGFKVSTIPMAHRFIIGILGLATLIALFLAWFPRFIFINW